VARKKGRPRAQVGRSDRLKDVEVERARERLDRVLREMRPARSRIASDAFVRHGSALRAGMALQIFEDQLRSRELDAAARALRAEGRGFYTIQSAGHEQNAVLGELLCATDPCLLHYRSGALMMARARRFSRRNPLVDTLLSICASREDPIAQGRHKVWGSRELWVLPQTSTIASQVPRAVGIAFAHARAQKLGLPMPLPDDAIVCCSFGDASVNHATALSGFHAARYARRAGQPLAILFVCEDNGIGISVKTPEHWIERSFRALPQLEYVRAAGGLDEIFDSAAGAIALCREQRRPVFLHLDTVRLFGHAGSDVELAYRTSEAIADDEARDPLVRNAARLIETGCATPDELAALVERARDDVAAALRVVADRPTLHDRADVMATLAPYDRAACLATARTAIDPAARSRCFGDPLPEHTSAPSRRTLAAHLNSALADEMLRRPEIWVFGEDVARKGGVYHVTAGLFERFGAGRVFDTMLDETTILGLALGAGQLGLLPVPEIQYLAYVHNALDQLRGEACSQSFFSSGQFLNPMVVRIAGLAYQRGFGGHFHNDNAVAALREIPSLMLAVPSRGDDGARLLRGAIALARTCGRVVCLLEPIALYHEKDLHEDGDAGWLFPYPPVDEALLPGDLGVYGAGNDVLIASYANGLRLSLRAARRLEREHGLRARVVDLRWLSPLPLDEVLAQARECGALLVADECRTSGGVADALLAHAAERGFDRPLGSVRSADSYVPLGPAASHVLLSEDQIVARARELCDRATRPRG
jgi:2-oxoisovalerate dehydrogenase E1 component